MQATGSVAGQNGSINLTITVTNLDDEAPQFTTPTGITVEAGTQTLSAPIDIDATDDFTTAANTGDPEAEISYAIVAGDAGGNFAIDNDGIITVADRPTFSATADDNERTLTIRATDTSAGAAGETTTEETITIEVTAPLTIALQTSAAGGATTITIDESDGSPADVTTISITTPGVTPAAANPYTLAAGSPAGFAINTAGELTAQFDYEALGAEDRTRAITIRANGDVTGQTGTIVLTITVNNIDDEAPQFTTPTGITVEAETQTLSAPIDIDATDDFTTAANTGDPEAEISYAIVAGDAGGNFAIDNDGVITVADGNRPTFSATTPDDNERTLTIRATDTSAGAAGETTTEETITIEVTAPLTIDLESTEGVVIAIDEDDTAPVDVTTISATTAGVTLTANPYALAAGSPAGFAINTVGELTAQLDYDALTPDQQTNGITITVQATGSVAGQTGTIELTITVNNIDDEAPQFTTPTGITVEAGTQTLSAPIDIDATDDFTTAANTGDPEAEISYVFLDNSDNPVTANAANLSIFNDFAIDANTGAITVTTAPTYAGDATDTRTLTIRATDTSPGVTQLATEKTITIAIAPPATFAITSDANSSRVDERDTAGGEEVTLATLTATYPVATGGANVNGVTYAISAALAHPFTITDNRLILPADATVDYEAASTYALTISGTVEGSTAPNIEITVAINNLDDEAPVFGNIPTGVTVEGGTTTLSETVIITATDGDDGPVGNDNDISYAIVGGSLTGGASFAIDAVTGEITVASAPTYLSSAENNMLSFTIRATDTSTEAIEGTTTATATITIEVTQPTVLILNSTMGTEITQDENDNEAILITIIASEGLPGIGREPDAVRIIGNRPEFTIINAAGNGFITAQLDYEALTPEEQTNGIMITVEATNREAGLTGTIDLTIIVNDLED